MSTEPTGNYTPSPIERLTTRTIEQRTLEVLERIELLLIGRFCVPSNYAAPDPNRGNMTVPVPQQDTSAPKSRFGGRRGK